MEYRRLGKSGLPVSELSFGSWITFGNQINNSVSEELMVTAYDAGINFFVGLRPGSATDIIERGGRE